MYRRRLADLIDREKWSQMLGEHCFEKLRNNRRDLDSSELFRDNSKEIRLVYQCVFTPLLHDLKLLAS